LEFNFLLRTRDDTERSSPDMDKSPFDCCIKELVDDVGRDFSFKDLKRTR
jgi:hypothetical protein